jgi:hypothetical protein
MDRRRGKAFLPAKKPGREDGFRSLAAVACGYTPLTAGSESGADHA